MSLDLKQYIRAVPDFPKPGYRFWDINSILESPKAFSFVNDQIEERWAGTVDAVVSLESRGNYFAPVFADRQKVPWAPIRKKGKLPGKVVSVNYGVEYRPEDCIEFQEGTFSPDMRVLVIDDVLATGGTAEAARKALTLAHRNVVGYAFVIELGYLDGRTKLGEDLPIQSLVTYTQEDLVAKAA